MNNIKEIQNLLKTFEGLPKSKYETTYLDICRYSGRRFEEICSRILSFYFQPNNEHDLKTLLIEALFETIGFNYDYIECKNVVIKTEESAEGYRLDLIIYNDDWVIGIENKVGANVYNPLDKYKKRINQYSKNNQFYIILSLYEIENKNELMNINKNDFKVVLYSDLFNSVKNKIGNYVSGNNMKYIFFLYDFIQTLEYMKGDNIMNKELDVFFNENASRLDELLNSYNEFKDKKNQKCFKKTSDIKQKMVEMTKDDNWKIYLGGTLYYKKNNIGFESWFAEHDNDPIKYFDIKITSWSAKAWNQYGEQLKKIYPKAKVELDGSRAYLYIYEYIDGHNEKDITSKLTECYKCISNLKD